MSGASAMENESFGEMLRQRWPRLANVSLLLVLVTGLVFMLANYRPDVTFEGAALWPRYATGLDDRLIPVVVWERADHVPVQGAKVTLYQAVGVKKDDRFSGHSEVYDYQD